MSGDYLLSGYAISPNQTSRFRTAGIVHLPGALSAYVDLLRDTFGTELDARPSVPRTSVVGSANTTLAPVMARLLLAAVGPVIDGLTGCAMTFLQASTRVGSSTGHWYHDGQPGLMIVRAMTTFSDGQAPWPVIRAVPGSHRDVNVHPPAAGTEPPHRPGDAVDEHAAVTTPLVPGDLLVYDTAITRAVDTPARYREILWTFARRPTSTDATSRLADYLRAAYSVL